MDIVFKRRLRKIILSLIIGFLILFAFRLIYGYTKTTNYSPSQSQFFESVSSSQRNYASTKYKVKSESSNQVSAKVDQKYEKVAEINSKSSKFEEEEKLARSLVSRYEALIQFEQKSGNKGSRKLNLLIGVPPNYFDSLYIDLIRIGIIQQKQITKKDKTNEYKELNAKKSSLEKIRNSLIDLKSRDGRIDEFMQLENRILEIEQQLQDLGVSLGDFDDENEFCTVRFSLLEGKEVKISFIHRLKVAFEWTIKYYLGFIAILTIINFFSFLILVVFEKVFRIIENLNDKN